MGLGPRLGHLLGGGGDPMSRKNRKKSNLAYDNTLHFENIRNKARYWYQNHWHKNHTLIY